MKMTDGFRMFFRRAVPVFLCAAFLTACATADPKPAMEVVPEVKPGILKGYLPTESLPNSLALIPLPPEDSSAAFALDKDVQERSRKLAETPRWELAAVDAELMFPAAAETFSCALGIAITKEETPHLYMVLRRSLADAGLSTYTAKDHYKRVRPFVMMEQPTCFPQDEDHLKNDGSYPSGHTAIGWAWALILTEIAPDRADRLIARGRAFGESRVVCNAHWYSDVMEGRFMGAATVAKLHADPVFCADLAAAKAEYAVALSKGLSPTGDCEAEAETLARYPLP
ncbi:acid phosphatase [Desulfoluna spongiiphila]|uniref:Acid phosphatase n=1 Tax=Desulfoluna spongiiphila TaxID=419481 RepID=A0A1G5IR63_9BACT|nr:phosphatase PAP2 family protein [Desulfoluna spongiiphila]SCY78503.1 acid phosphatase (class A) [Desulfoluna spongiiphila]VVS92537.1 acid phosphatase class a bacterial [Desulfoluna spongiiphila]